MSLPDITDFPVPPDRAEEGSDFVTALTTWIGGMNDAIDSINEFKDALQEEVPALANSIPKTIISNAGDIIYGSAAHTPARLPIGASGKTLRVVNGSLAWADADILMAGCYFRDTRLAAKTVSVAADRYTLLTPNRLLVDVGGVYLSLAAQQALVLSDATIWDSTSTDYTVAANRAGKDFSVYACLVGGVALKILISANATTPTGYTALTSRRIGGFHCLCASVGTISGHTLSGYVTGDILPASVWDLKHRPVCAPEGMVYIDGLGKWVDIYLASVSGGKLVSAYNATCADGASATLFDWYDFSEWLGRIGKRLPTQGEFMALANGSNEGTNIAGSADPGNTGGKVDTDGRRMVSNSGCEDACGNLWQWLCEAGGPYNTTASYIDQYTSRTSQRGQGYYVPNRGIAGGYWTAAAVCGSRGSSWANSPLALYALIGARGVAEPLAAEK